MVDARGQQIPPPPLLDLNRELNPSPAGMFVRQTGEELLCSFAHLLVSLPSTNAAAFYFCSMPLLLCVSSALCNPANFKALSISLALP